MVFVCFLNQEVAADQSCSRAEWVKWGGSDSRGACSCGSRLVQTPQSWTLRFMSGVVEYARRCDYCWLSLSWPRWPFNEVISSSLQPVMWCQTGGLTRFSEVFFSVASEIQRLQLGPSVLWFALRWRWIDWTSTSVSPWPWAPARLSERVLS